MGLVKMSYHVDGAHFALQFAEEVQVKSTTGTRFIYALVYDTYVVFVCLRRTSTYENGV